MILFKELRNNEAIDDFDIMYSYTMTRFFFDICIIMSEIFRQRTDARRYQNSKRLCEERILHIKRWHPIASVAVTYC